MLDLVVLLGLVFIDAAFHISVEEFDRSSFIEVVVGD